MPQKVAINDYTMFLSAASNLHERFEVLYDRAAAHVLQQPVS
jgi:hypothetical protein